MTATIAIAWLKAFHIVFVVTWFAGLFYLPRLFIYHLDAVDEVSKQRFATMERRLMMITNIGATLALIFGIALLMAWKSIAPDFMKQGWLHLKLMLVLLLVAYHGFCSVLVRQFREGRNRRSATWLRWFNEAPVVLLIAIVILVVVKPF
jgi:protoporphyrinogen IX oxidase